MTVEKEISVREAVRCESISIFWVGNWECNLSEGEIKDRKNRIIIRECSIDKWKWYKDVHSVREAYVVIMERLVSQIEHNKELAKVWSKIVLLIVSVLAWRIWTNRNPSRDDLVRRGILVESQNSCPLDCGKEESDDHIFFECPSLVLAWSEVLGWLNISYVSHKSVLYIKKIKFSKNKNVLSC